MIERFLKMRAKTEDICKPLLLEDYSVQPVEFVSPPKWHLAHTTWFWEAFVLTKYAPTYQVFSEDFSFLFNSYYNFVGKRILRQSRGLLTRPSVKEIYTYREYVTNAIVELIRTLEDKCVLDIIEIGINHEEQHQELLIYDIKYILGQQPTFPIYNDKLGIQKNTNQTGFTKIKAGLYEIGHEGSSFCFDNELNRHKVYVENYEISNSVVTNGAYLEFIKSGGYQNFEYWHDEGWSWVNMNKITSPLYWYLIDNEWHEYNLNGLSKLKLEEPVCHISFYEASAFAQWKECRLPTEFEWEVASNQLNWGQVWEWTNSAYLPYPGFSKSPGALGEYNGKFMINQMVMRGGSVATPLNHSRNTYRNFFHASMRWQYSGIRLAK